MPKFCSVQRNCQLCQKEIWIQPNVLKKGNGKYCSMSCRSKVNSPRIVHPPLTQEVIEKIRQANLGIKHPSNTGPLNKNWRGGVTSPEYRLRRYPRYALWRTAVFERDNYTCQLCGVRGGTLNADHIYPFSLYEELRFEVSNGRTLCYDCHRRTDTWGWNKQYLGSYHDATIMKAFMITFSH